MKRLFLGLALAFTLACGSSSPTAPSAPPAPVYPNLIAAWSGTATIGIVATSGAASNVCQTTWVISAQSEGAFSGTFQLSGGTSVPCGQSSNVSGTVTTTGAVSVQFTAGPPPAGCAVLTGTPLAGVVTASSMTLQQTVHLTCNSHAVDQTVTVALTKR